MIPRQFIDDLLARIDIIEIINSRVHLRKAGSNHLACCPFHNEKTPSFTVSSSKQFYHCFGCGAHGNAIDFLMKYENLDFVAAIEALAAHLGIEVARENSTKSDSKVKNHFNELYEILEKINSFYQTELKHNAAAINYLKKRGLSGQICKQFEIGFAPKNWENLQTFYNNNFAIKTQLVATGMLLEKKSIARFRDRIMFPIRDRRGRIIGFGGRTISDEMPKYLNSPETPIFHKGSELYGLYQAKKAQNNLTQLIVVEGYMDVVALAQFGITDAVASLGTAITPKQIQNLLLNTSEIIFCFDGDNAGLKAAWRALENSLPLIHDGVLLQFAFLPQGEDPDTFVRRVGKDEFLKYLQKASPLADFLFAHLMGQKSVNSLESRANLAKKTKDLLQKMPNGIFKQLILTKLAEIVRVSVDEITKAEPIQPEAFKRVSSAKAPLNPVETAIGLLLHDPKLVENVTDPEIETKLSPLKSIFLEIDLLISLIKLLKSQRNFTVGAILEYYRESSNVAVLTKLAIWEPMIKPEGLKNELLGSIQRIFEHGREQTIQMLMQKAAISSLTTEEKKLLQQLILDNKILF